MKQRLILALLIVFASFSSCKEDIEVVPAPIISGLENVYSILEDAELKLNPSIENDNNATYLWHMNGKEVAKTLDYLFVESVPGEYKLKLKVGNDGGVAEMEITISVVERGLAPVVTNVEKEYTIEVDSELKITPIITSEDEVTYAWLLGEEEVTAKSEHIFSKLQPGKHDITFKATNQWGTTEVVFSVIVTPKVITIETVAHTLLSLVTPVNVAEGKEIEWKVLETPSGLYRVSQMKSKTPMFIAAKEGEYLLQFTSGDIIGKVKIVVIKPKKTPSAYFANAFEYLPAPGQFVNTMPKYEEGDTEKDMVAKVAEALVGDDARMITLGGWGGYVTMGFDHTIVNVAGKKDFRIEGNAFGANSNPNINPPFGGSCEPAIIMVSYDANENGKPDDEWYEIKGSGSFTAKDEAFYQKGIESENDMNTHRDFEMIYHKPKVETPANITNYIYWTNNKGKDGYKFKHSYHKQSYYPLWVKDETIKFKGIRLAENGIDESGEGNYFVLYAFKYGYVDNFPNNDDRSAIDIDWAIDKDGNKANLPGINFVKVYNGVDQENGWLGEASSEVARGSDLHLLGKSIDTIKE